MTRLMPALSARLGQIRQSQPHLATAHCATPDIRRGYACRRHHQLLGVAVASQQQLKRPRNAVIDGFVYFEGSDNAYSAYINHQLKESLSTGDAAESIGVNLWWKWSLFCSI